ncbi:unnamed protein product [Clavelina lepadiformis]|uniref:Secreted protein n=1 Tax=Clavelina lepadiformis TaxID=159417 RepID=A0ABP0GMV0_CLALP
MKPTSSLLFTIILTQTLLLFMDEITVKAPASPQLCARLMIYVVTCLFHFKQSFIFCCRSKDIVKFYFLNKFLFHFFRTNVFFYNILLLDTTENGCLRFI